MGRTHLAGHHTGRRLAWWAVGAGLVVAATAAAAIGIALVAHFRTASATIELEYEVLTQSLPEAPPASAPDGDVNAPRGFFDRAVLPVTVPTATPTPTPTLPPPTAPASPEPTPTPKPMFDRPAHGRVTTAMRPGHPNGVDLGVPIGAPIFAARDGVVSFAGGDPCCEYGYYIIIEHADGWTSLYAHFSAFKVRAGERVKQGQTIGLAGDTGQAHGSHLHFELRHHGVPIDPLLYFPPR